MTGITPENVGKHGVLTLGESRLVGTVEYRDDLEFEFVVDGSDSVVISNRGWSFTPDAPKARLGMIVNLYGAYLIRRRNGWWTVTNNMDAPTYAPAADGDMSAAEVVFPGVADL